eukprot:2111280-Amphidinium_carterae.1
MANAAGTCLPLCLCVHVCQAVCSEDANGQPGARLLNLETQTTPGILHFKGNFAKCYKSVLTIK